MNEIMESLYQRKSMRVYEDREIPEEMKKLILKAASQAPTAGCQQLYTILDITDQKLKEALSESCDHQPFIAKAPMVLVFCADCKKWYDAYLEAGCEPRKPGVGDLMLAVTDTVIAAQNAVVAAESFGLGSCYIVILWKTAKNSGDCYVFLTMYFRQQCWYLDGRRNSRSNVRSRNGVNRSISCMRIHTAIWTEKNYVKCLHTNVKTVPMKSGVMHFVIVNIIPIFPKK